MQFIESFAWVPSLGIEYHLGVDGLGLLMVLLSALVPVVPFALLASWKIENNPQALFFSGAVSGVGSLQHLLRRRISSIGFVLGTESDPGLLPHPNLGRA